MPRTKRTQTSKPLERFYILSGSRFAIRVDKAGNELTDNYRYAHCKEYIEDGKSYYCLPVVGPGFDGDLVNCLEYPDSETMHWNWDIVRDSEIVNLFLDFLRTKNIELLEQANAIRSRDRAIKAIQEEENKNRANFVLESAKSNAADDLQEFYKLDARIWEFLSEVISMKKAQDRIVESTGIKLSNDNRIRKLIQEIGQTYLIGSPNLSRAA